MSEDNLTMQEDEIEAIKSIYGEWVKTRLNDGQRTCDIYIDDVLLSVTMPLSYPKESPPVFEISAPFLPGHEKQNLTRKLETVYADSFVGEPGVVYAWVECIQEFTNQWTASKGGLSTLASFVDSTGDELSAEMSAKLTVSAENEIECPEILTGGCIEDRKSVFQPHFAEVHSVAEVKAVVRKLMENRKIANATHNMYAYRIKVEGRGILQDCEDDGETHAGSRMLHLLDILNVENVLVVVSRWYGGIQLGPDRFKHINGVTRAILEQAGVLKEATKTNGNNTTKKTKK